MLEMVVPLVLIFGSAAVAVEEADRPSATEENARFWERVYSGEKVLDVHFILEREDWDKTQPKLGLTLPGRRR